MVLERKVNMLWTSICIWGISEMLLQDHTQVYLPWALLTHMEDPLMKGAVSEIRRTMLIHMMCATPVWWMRLHIPLSTRLLLDWDALIKWDDYWRSMWKFHTVATNNIFIGFYIIQPIIASSNLMFVTDISQKDVCWVMSVMQEKFPSIKNPHVIEKQVMGAKALDFSDEYTRQNSKTPLDKTTKQMNLFHCQVLGRDVWNHLSSGWSTSPRVGSFSATSRSSLKLSK